MREWNSDERNMLGMSDKIAQRDELMALENKTISDWTVLSPFRFGAYS